MMYTVKAGETIEIPELSGALITNTGTSTDSFTVKDGVVEAGLECFSSWSVSVANALLDVPAVKYA